MDTSQLSTIVWFAALIAVFYFLLIRPQQQRAKKHKNLVSGLEVGSKVVTIGGVHGIIRSLKEDVVILEVAKDTKITVNKSSIGKTQDKTQDKGGKK